LRTTEWFHGDSNISDYQVLASEGKMENKIIIG